MRHKKSWAVVSVDKSSTEATALVKNYNSIIISSFLLHGS